MGPHLEEIRFRRSRDCGFGVIEEEDLPRQALVKGAYLMDKLRRDRIAEHP